MASSETIAVVRQGPIAIVEIRRPEVRNALDRQSSAALTEVFLEIDCDPEIRALVLTGQDGHFCAGADLAEMSRGAVYEPWATSHLGPTRRTLSKPVLAAVEGHACAGGLGLALWCDLRIIDETAVFGVFSRRWGVPMSDGTTVRLPRLIGQGRALDLLLTGRSVYAQEAIDIGLANRLVDKGATLREAVRLAETIASFPQAAMLADRHSAYCQLDGSLEAGLRSETEGALRARDEEARVGASRFVAGEGRHGESISERPK